MSARRATHLWLRPIDGAAWRLRCDRCEADLPVDLPADGPEGLQRVAEYVVMFVGVHGRCGEPPRCRECGGAERWAGGVMSS